MVYLLFVLLGFYLGGMPITAVVVYAGITSVNTDEYRAKRLIWTIKVTLEWPVIMPMAVYGLRKELKSRKTEY